MKNVIYAFLIISTTVLSKDIINLQTDKKDFYSQPFLSGAIAFNMLDYPLLILELDYSKFDNIIHSSKQDKYFWLSSETFISLLGRYTFKGSDYFYFAVKDSKGELYKKSFFKINTKQLKKYENRDFGEKDKTLLKSSNIKKYNLTSIDDLFKTFKLVTNPKNTKYTKINKILTKNYLEFLSEATLAINDIESKISDAKDELQDIQKNIHYYCKDGDIEKVKIYTNMNFNINKQDTKNKQTCLQYATLGNHYNIVKYLINHGADANRHKKGFENAYLVAKRLGHKRIARLLKPLTKIKSRYTSTNASNNTNRGLPKSQCYRVSGNYALYKYCTTGSCDGFVSNYKLHQLCKYNKNVFYDGNRNANINYYLRNGGNLGYDYFDDKAAYQSGKFNGSFQDRKNFILYLLEGVTLIK